jgi:hypothetical protein
MTGGTDPQREPSVPIVLVVVLTALVALGCSRDIQRPLVHPVEGRVTLDGQPLEGVGVSLSPVVPGMGAAAFGKTRTDGSFTLTSTHGGRQGAGAMAGEYAVMFQKFIDVAPGDVPPQFVPAADDPSRQVQRWFTREDAIRLENDETIRYVVLGLIPEAYGRADTSGFRATVVPGRNAGEAFTFHLSREFVSPKKR